MLGGLRPKLTNASWSMPGLVVAFLDGVRGTSRFSPGEAEDVQMASGEGREKSSVACASQSGIARHLSIGSSVLGTQPPFRTADPAACDRFVLARPPDPRQWGLSCARSSARS